MGIIILILAAVIEAAFGIFCLITKSNQKSIRSWVRIGAFAAFVTFTLLSVIQWSFRWVLLTAVLLIWAIVGGVSLLRKRADQKEFKAARIVFKAIALWLVVLITVIPALIFPQYKLPKASGAQKVDTALYTYTDDSRIETFSKTGIPRKVTVEFWYPGHLSDASDKYPLIVFSHGAFGVRTSNTSTFMELASNGYIVCSIDHPYHAFFTIGADGKLTMADKSFIQQVADVNNGVYDAETSFKLEQQWLKVQTGDMNFVLDLIRKKSIDKEAGKVYQLIDIDKIGLIGHSLGGAASAKLGRERKDIGAVINLDADLLGEETGFAGGKLLINHAIYPIPLLSIYSDAMKRLMDSVTDPDIVIPQRLISATAPHAYEVYIKGTNHLSLTDLSLASPFLVNMINGAIKKAGGRQTADKYYVIETMNRIVLEFFDCYLKGKGSFHSAGTY